MGQDIDSAIRQVESFESGPLNWWKNAMLVSATGRVSPGKTTNARGEQNYFVNLDFVTTWQLLVIKTTRSEREMSSLELLSWLLGFEYGLSRFEGKSETC